MSGGKRFLIIHGHFYQPPRENPWTGVIQEQESAYPFHDWNERIAAECYAPNAFSRVLDGGGRILKIVNNYASLSFNIGPTLFSWLESHVPEVYRRILEADAESVKRLGLGNAIAQAYHHAILPLANARDRRTEILWGIEDFRTRFSRDPLGLWLPETAVDYPTLRTLAEAGIRFIILSPSQARRFRRLGEKAWVEARKGLDPRRPYRCFMRDEKGQPLEPFIDIFFYEPAISRAVSFEHLLRNAGNLADRIEAAYRPDRKEDQVVVVAADGETFGHHEPFADMCLAYLFAVEVPRRGITVTNPGAYLQDHPPTYEVEIEERTSWSCPHRLGRWREDCGCSTGGKAGWHQRWRAPLRRGLDRLRDELALIFETEGEKLLKDPWAARDEYIRVVLDRDPSSTDRFLSHHQVKPLSPEEQGRALRLLEMERHALMMYTSCGWFFADLAGIETVQILRYAARAIELAQPFAGKDLEALLLDELEKAESNVAGNGRRIWELQVKPSQVGIDRATAFYAIVSFFRPWSDPCQVYTFEATCLSREQIPFDGGDLLLGGLHLRSTITREEGQRAFALHRTGVKVSCAVFPWEEAWQRVVREAREKVKGGVERFFARLQQEGAKLFSLRDLFPEERKAYLEALFKEREEAIAGRYLAIYRENQDLIEALHEASLPLPPGLKAALDFALNVQVRETLQRLPSAPAEGAKTLLQVIQKAERFNLELDLQRVPIAIVGVLQKGMEGLVKALDEARCQELLEFLQGAQRLKLPLDLAGPQNLMMEILERDLPPLLERVAKEGDPAAYRLVSSVLHLAERLNFNVEEERRQLGPFEERLAAEPDLWP